MMYVNAGWMAGWRACAHSRPQSKTVALLKFMFLSWNGGSGEKRNGFYLHFAFFSRQYAFDVHSAFSFVHHLVTLFWPNIKHENTTWMHCDGAKYDARLFCVYVVARASHRAWSIANNERTKTKKMAMVWLPVCFAQVVWWRYRSQSHRARDYFHIFQS